MIVFVLNATLSVWAYQRIEIDLRERSFVIVIVDEIICKSLEAH